jgi:CHAT domain-containing protein
VDANRFDEAAAVYRGVLEKATAAHDQQAQARIHDGLGYILNRQAAFPAARAESEQALELYESLHDVAEAATVSARLGMIAYFMGDQALARSYYRKALEQFDGLGELPSKAMMLRNLDRAGDPDGDHLLQQGLEISRQIGDKNLEANIVHGQGDRMFQRGDLAAAQEKYSQAVELYQQAGDDGEGLARVLTSEGRLQRVHGHPEKAIPLYQQALDLQKSLGDRAGAIQSTNAMAVAYGLLDPVKAIELYQQALAMARETGSERFIIFEQGNLANAYTDVGRYQEALPILLELLQKDVDYPENRYGGLGTAYLGLGRFSDAVDACSKAITISREKNKWEMLLEALSTRAMAEDRLGKEEAALADVQEALRAIEDLRTRLVPSDFMKRGFSERMQEVYGLHVRLLEQAHQVDRALEVAEEARARAFLDLLATRDLQAKAVPQQHLASRENADQRSPTSGAQPNAPGGILTRGTPEPAVKPDPLVRPDTELRSMVSVPPFSSLEMQATARRLNSTIISYWVARDVTYIWATPPEGETRTAMARVSLKEIEELITALGPGRLTSGKQNVARSGKREPQRVASGMTAQKPMVFHEVSARGGTILTGSIHRKEWRELYRLLIQPVEAWLPSKPGSLLTIEPHGPLLMLPFAALTDPQGRYLLERFSLHYTPAVSLLQFTEKKKQEIQGKPAHYLLVADPIGMPLGPDANKLPALPGSRREVDGVARLLPAAEVTLLEGRQASEIRVAKLARENTVLHFATHGIIRNDQPFDSFLALGSNSADPAQDGRLTAQEIYGLELHADLVFLSACRSGLGKVSGDGLVGLTRAFWYAGTPSVIASLWDVADEPTYLLVTNFYRSRLRGHDKSRALRSAQLRLLRRLRAAQVAVHTSTGVAVLPEDPIFWAGFVLQGEP